MDIVYIIHWFSASPCRQFPNYFIDFSVLFQVSSYFLPKVFLQFFQKIHNSSHIPLPRATGRQEAAHLVGCPSTALSRRPQTGGGYDGESFLLCGVSSQKDVRGRERIGPNPLQDGWGCAIMGTLERCQLGEWGLPRSFFYESSLVLSPAGGAGRFSDRFSSRAAGRREVFIVCLKSRI